MRWVVLASALVACDPRPPAQTPAACDAPDGEGCCAIESQALPWDAVVGWGCATEGELIRLRDDYDLADFVAGCTAPQFDPDTFALDWDAVDVVGGSVDALCPLGAHQVSRAVVCNGFMGAELTWEPDWCRCDWIEPRVQLFVVPEGSVRHLDLTGGPEVPCEEATCECVGEQVPACDGCYG